MRTSERLFGEVTVEYEENNISQTEASSSEGFHIVETW
jgi:hypothetical protein